MSLDISPLEVCWVRLAATHRGAPMSEPGQGQQLAGAAAQDHPREAVGQDGQARPVGEGPAHQSLCAQADLDDPAVEGVVQLAANAVEHHAPVLGHLGLRGVEPLLEVHEGVDRQPGDALAVGSRHLPVGGDAGSRHRGDGLHHQHARVLGAGPRAGAGGGHGGGGERGRAQREPGDARGHGRPDNPLVRGRSCRGLGEYRGTHGFTWASPTRPEGGDGQECAHREDHTRVERVDRGGVGSHHRRQIALGGEHDGIPGRLRRSRRRP